MPYLSEVQISDFEFPVVIRSAETNINFFGKLRYIERGGRHGVYLVISDDGVSRKTFGPVHSDDDIVYQDSRKPVQFPV